MLNLEFTPKYPQIGDDVTVVVSCDQGLSNVKLNVIQPNGETLQRGPVQVGKDGDLHIWTYELSPPQQRGNHEVHFTTDGDEFIIATMRVYAGFPREQYERTYVLLPQDADATWASVVIEETWNERRFTVGSSADDAGIGDLDVRKIILINPSRWTGDAQELIDFYKEYYPGVELAIIEADEPEQLRGRFPADLTFSVAMPS